MSLGLVVSLDIAVLAHAFGILHAVRVIAVAHLAAAAVPVVAVVAHALREVLQVHVRALRDNLCLSAVRLPSVRALTKVCVSQQRFC